MVPDMMFIETPQMEKNLQFLAILILMKFCAKKFATNLRLEDPNTLPLQKSNKKDIFHLSVYNFYVL